jgi:hypothetical protein
MRLLNDFARGDELERYSYSMERIPGWFANADLQLFKITTDVQHSLGIRGDVLEIGTYFGRSGILLGYLVDDDEQLVICDLFDLPPASTVGQDELAGFSGPQPTQADFEANFLRFHSKLPTILRQPSTQLPTPLPPDAKFRFIHIDGSHVYSEVKDDIARALELIGPGGVIVFDDFSSSHLPGVAAGVWEAVIAEEVIPVCVSPSKMYAVAGREKGQPIVAALSEALIANGAATTAPHPVVGHEVLAVDFPAGAVAVQRRRAHRLAARFQKRVKADA